MQNKLLNNGSQKEHEMRKGGGWLKRMNRGRGKELFLFTLLTIMLFTALIWSYEPHLAILLSPQEQFGLITTPADSLKQEDNLVREIHTKTKDGFKPEIVNAEITDHGSELEAPISEGSPGSSVIEDSSTKGSLATKEDIKNDKDSPSFNDNKGSYTTQGQSEIGGPSASEVSLATKTEEKEGLKDSPPSFEKKKTEDKTKPQIENVEKPKPVSEESLASKESSMTQSSSITEGLSTTNASSPTEGSLEREKEDKDSSSTAQKKDIAKPQDQPLQEPLPAPTGTEDKPKLPTKNVQNTKPVAKESFTPEESSASQNSSVTEAPSASIGPSPTQGTLRTEKEDKVSASTSEKIETKDKPKPLADNVADTKQAAKDKESLASEGSSTSQGSSTNSSSTKESLATTKEDGDLTSTSDKKVCNYAKGRWVFDSKRSLYSGFKCKQWLSWMFACRLTTRPDFRFEQYKWQPENCDMPEFERSSFLKRMQNKTIAFVGDSLGRQQFQSLMCMLTGGEESPEVEDVGQEFGLSPKNVAFRFPQTNTTILYYWSSCLCDLVPLNSSDPNSEVAMHLDRPPSFLVHNIHKLDVLVLNTGHHWNRGKFNLNRWVMHLDGKPNEDTSFSNVRNAKNFTIFSIVKWVDSQLKSHPRGLKAFFRSISPRHFFNGEWNTGGSCENTTPLVRGSEVNQDEPSDQLVANAVKGTQVKLLDITALSALRDEGHISKYGHKADSDIRDCLHWCLPGIPDTWNEILAAQI